MARKSQSASLTATAVGADAEQKALSRLWRAQPIHVAGVSTATVKTLTRVLRSFKIVRQSMEWTPMVFVTRAEAFTPRCTPVCTLSRTPRRQ